MKTTVSNGTKKGIEDVGIRALGFVVFGYRRDWVVVEPVNYPIPTEIEPLVRTVARRFSEQFVEGIKLLELAERNYLSCKSLIVDFKVVKGDVV